MIAIIDYGVGNLASVQNAFRRVGYPSLVTDQPEQILGAEKVVLPGVGAFADGMTTLRKKGLTDVLYEVVEKEIPLLGICLGMQMLFSTSEEEGLHQGLDLIPGRVRRFSLSGAYKVPHMGWNQIWILASQRLLPFGCGQCHRACRCRVCRHGRHGQHTQYHGYCQEQG